MKNSVVLITPMGGHGTVFIKKQANMLPRPDTVFGDRVDITKKLKQVSVDWDMRSGGLTFNYNETIEWNLLQVLKQNKNVLLSGRCSMVHPFLTRNNIKAICLVRHPLHAYVSFLKYRHPEVVKHLGGFNTDRAVLWYADRWNAIVEDFISSGNTIYRYEYFMEELPDSWLKNRLSTHWDGSSKHYNELNNTKLESLLYELVNDNFNRIYDNWYPCRK